MKKNLLKHIPVLIFIIVILTGCNGEIFGDTYSFSYVTTEKSALNSQKKGNYHGQVYTGGSYSQKYHYEAQCAGKNSHKITWEDVERRKLGPCGTCVLK